MIWVYAFHELQKDFTIFKEIFWLILAVWSTGSHIKKIVLKEIPQGCQLLAYLPYKNFYIVSRKWRNLYWDLHLKYLLMFILFILEQIKKTHEIMKQQFWFNCAQYKFFPSNSVVSPTYFKPCHSGWYNTSSSLQYLGL